LSLFFIDEVAKYRDYNREDEKGDYARIFEEEYAQITQEFLEILPFENESWRRYLQECVASKTHAGYFSIDKKSKRLVNPDSERRGENAGLSRDVEAYDLILRDKERLLSFDEPVSFIFSHSALREGWDNPNIFTLCMLKHSDNTISRRQEVGRGLRLCVDQSGQRIDDPAIVHDINKLTVVVNETYQDFVENLQREIKNSLSRRPLIAKIDYLQDHLAITKEQATKIYRWLAKNDYSNDDDTVSNHYIQARKSGTLVALPEELCPFQSSIFALLDSMANQDSLPPLENSNQTKISNRLNENFNTKEFQELWARINKHAIYQVNFESEELINKSISALNTLNVAKLSYQLHSGIQHDHISYEQLQEAQGFGLKKTQNSCVGSSLHSKVRYDLIGKIAEKVNLTRKTIAAILMGMESKVFEQFKHNPEQFIMEACRLINEQMGSKIVEHLTYDKVAGCYDSAIFTSAANNRQIFNPKAKTLKKHIFDYLVADSEVERKFADELDVCDEVIVYAKLPNAFKIPTPVGDYTPDWAISFRKQLYFVAETKGSLSSLQLTGSEKAKIDSAKKFFALINQRIDQDKVHYEMVTNLDDLQKIIEAQCRL